MRPKVDRNPGREAKQEGVERFEIPREDLYLYEIGLLPAKVGVRRMAGAAAAACCGAAGRCAAGITWLCALLCR